MKPKRISKQSHSPKEMQASLGTDMQGLYLCVLQSDIFRIESKAWYNPKKIGQAFAPITSLRFLCLTSELCT